MSGQSGKEQKVKKNRLPSRQRVGWLQQPPPWSGLQSLCAESSVFHFGLIFWSTACYLPTAAVTNYPQCNGSKEHKSILTSFWRSEVWNGSQGTKIEMSAGLSSFWRLHGMMFPHLFQLLKAAHIPRFVVPSSILEASSRVSSNLCASSAFIITSPSLTRELLPPSYEDPTDSMWPTQITQGDLPVSRSLSNHIGKVPFAIKIKCSQDTTGGEGHDHIHHTLFSHVSFLKNVL